MEVDNKLRGILRTPPSDDVKLGSTILKTIGTFEVFDIESTPGQMTRDRSKFLSNISSILGDKQFSAMLGYLYILLSEEYGYGALDKLEDFLARWKSNPWKALLSLLATNEESRERLLFLLENREGKFLDTMKEKVREYLSGKPLAIELVDREEELELLQQIEELGTPKSLEPYANALKGGILNREGLQRIEEKIRQFRAKGTIAQPEIVQLDTISPPEFSKLPIEKKKEYLRELVPKTDLPPELKDRILFLTGNIQSLKIRDVYLGVIKRLKGITPSIDPVSREEELALLQRIEELGNPPGLASIEQLLRNGVLTYKSLEAAKKAVENQIRKQKAQG